MSDNILFGVLVLIILGFLVFPIIAGATGNNTWLVGTAISIPLQLLLVGYDMITS
jgi:hypothetical protein